MPSVLTTHLLCKRFGRITAVDDLSLTVDAGEIYGFLGLNGAGKTTTIRMLLGMIRPTSGRTEVLGVEIRKGGGGPWESVGYLVETPAAYPELTVRENLEVVRRLRSANPQSVDDIIERLGLSSNADRRAGHLSLGNAQRLGLAKAMLHRPQLLILDEPANGLDPAGIVEIREHLRSLTRDEGVTVFMSSHILGEVSRLATRIGILHRGRLLTEQTSEEVESSRRRRLLVEARDQRGALSIISEAGYHVSMSPEGLIEVTDPRAHDRPEDISRLLVLAGHPPSMVRVEREDLESYFLRITANFGDSAS